MLSTTLQEGLSEYAIGAKIRALRLKKKMGLVELGQHTGLSPALLSKIERGRLFPTLPTLLRVALVFSVGLEYFFAGSRDRAADRGGAQARPGALPERPARATSPIASNRSTIRRGERRFNTYLAEFLPVAPEKLQPHEHPGVEFIYTLQGSLTVHINGRRPHARQRRLDLLRRHAPARVSPQRRPGLHRHRRHLAVSGLAGVALQVPANRAVAATRLVRNS